MHGCSLLVPLNEEIARESHLQVDTADETNVDILV